MGHTYTNLLYHVVSSTKGRTPQILPDMRPRLDAYIGGIVREEGGTLLAAGGIEDHSHWLISARPDTAPSHLVRTIKANSSGWVHKTFPASAGFQWQAGYGLFSVSKSKEDEVRAYIDNQAEHHKKMTFLEELAVLLKKHGVSFDPRYMGD